MGCYDNVSAFAPHDLQEAFVSTYDELLLLLFCPIYYIPPKKWVPRLHTCAGVLPEPLLRLVVRSKMEKKMKENANKPPDKKSA